MAEIELGHVRLDNVKISGRNESCKGVSIYNVEGDIDFGEGGLSLKRSCPLTFPSATSLKD